MTWGVKDADRSLANADCLVCKKLKTAKEMGISLCVGSNQINRKGFVCRECFEKDIILIKDIDINDRQCGVCFICEENFTEGNFMMTGSYTFEIIEKMENNHHNIICCFHMHEDCFEGSASEEWIFNDKERGIFDEL